MTNNDIMQEIKALMRNNYVDQSVAITTCFDNAMARSLVAGDSNDTYRDIKTFVDVALSFPGLEGVMINKMCEFVERPKNFDMIMKYGSELEDQKVSNQINASILGMEYLVQKLFESEYVMSDAQIRGIKDAYIAWGMTTKEYAGVRSMAENNWLVAPVMELEFLSRMSRDLYGSDYQKRYGAKAIDNIFASIKDEISATGCNGSSADIAYTYAKYKYDHRNDPKYPLDNHIYSNPIKKFEGEQVGDAEAAGDEFDSMWNGVEDISSPNTQDTTGGGQGD